MLKILVEGVDTIPGEVWDAEQLFDTTGVVNTPVVRKFIERIEQGEYVSPTRFADRFGVQLYTNCLSTGCKAAIALSLNPTKILDAVEVGYNALSEMIRLCAEGTILVPNQPIGIVTLYEETCDALFLGYRFTSMQRLYEYMRYGWGVAPATYFKELEEDV